MNGEDQRILAILTLRRHKDGVWIHRLVASLQKIVPTTTVRIQVIDLEDHLQGPFNVSKPDPNHWLGLINRVSDAAEPWEVKTAMALLQLAKQVWKIPIWNGPDAYSLCTHKWCHHVLFSQAGLKSPNTVASLQPQQQQSSETEDLESKSISMLQQTCNSTGTTLDYLIKPNAGGFGAGIERRKVNLQFSSDEDASQAPLPNYLDRMILFQSYIAPCDGKIYRVWFLRDKAQCAIERTVDSIANSDTETSNSEFTSGCVAGVCSRPQKKREKAASPPPNIQSWSVPEAVRKEIERQLLPVLPDDCHCGSVEFLCTDDAEQERLYFDLNLLSTLPVEESATDPDPWAELATAIWSLIMS